MNSDEPHRVQGLRVTQDAISFQLDESHLDTSQLTTVWYRKGRHWLCNVFIPPAEPLTPHLQAYLKAKLKTEELRLSQYIHAQIEAQARCLGTSEGGDVNKLLVLQAAASCGFTVPRFLVSTSPEALSAEIATYQAAVSKAISDGLYLFDHTSSSQGFYTYTEEVSTDSLGDLPPNISPSLVQAQIRKKLDLRVFFLDGSCHAMAIFSQADARTRVDFRRYNDERPNRAVPYLLPADVEDRLRALFSMLGQDTGSVDLVLDDSGDYVFLEINPVGQFGMVSEPCNYYLEREVARTLIDYESS